MNFYKLAKTDGFDFYTSKSINFRDNIGKVVSVKDIGNYELCSSSVIHASKNPNDCFVGVSIPCSAYLVSGTPVIESEKKCGFVSLKVIREIKNLNKLFGWNYKEAVNPINPFQITPPPITKKEIKLLKNWDSVWASVGDSVWASVRASVGDSVRDSVRDSVGDSVRDSVGDSVWASVRASVRASLWASLGDSVGDSVGDSLGDSVWASVWAYIGSFFKIEQWKYVKHKSGVYPFKSVVDLWKMGLIASFDEKTWRLHGGEGGKILYEWKGDK